MAITRFRSTRQGLSPWQEMEELTSRLGRMLGETAPTDWREGTDGPTWLPPVDVQESGEELILTAELPGMTHDDVEIELENNVLTIRGQKQETRQEGGEDRRYHLWERRYGSFQRSFTLPRTVRAEEINARFRDGVLHVHMPKVPEAKGRKIQIRTESES